MLTSNQPEFRRRLLESHGVYPGRSIQGRIVIFLVILLGLSGSALAQLVVQPMKLELSVRGGQVFKKQILIQDYHPNDSRNVLLEVADLGQSEKGGTWITMSGASKTGQADANTPSSAISCRSWLTLGKDHVFIKNKKSIPVDVSVKVPAGVRGFYCAAILATFEPRAGEGGTVKVSYQMVVPVLVEVEGIPLHNNVSLDEAAVKEIKGADGKGSTELSFTVSNSGDTMASVLGKGWIKYWDDQNKRWRPVASDIDMVDHALIPGAKTVFSKDIGKELPTGRYRILGRLNVEGRKSDVFDKQIHFVGKAGTNLVADSAVRCDRDVVQIDGQEGRTRREIVELRNYSLYPITVRASAVIPKAMKGKIWYGRKGDDMSCAKWIEVRPEEVRLQPFASRNVSVVARIPSGGYRSAGYYADLIFESKYDKDGSNAGSTTVLACVRDTKVKHALNVEANGLKLNSLDGSGKRYIIATNFQNLGDLDVLPQVRARLISIPSQQAINEWKLSNTAKTGVMLPYERRSFSEVITLANLDEGTYQLTTEFLNDGKVIASIKKNLKIYREGGQKMVEVNSNAPNQTEAGSETPTVSW